MSPKTICLIFLFISLCNCEAWIDILKEEVQHLQKPFPENADNYIVDINSMLVIAQDKFELDQLEDKLQEKEMEEELKNKIRAILWTDSITFQGFCFNFFHNLSSLFELAGMVRKTNGIVELLYFVTNTSGNVKQQYEIVTIKYCDSFFGLFDIWCMTINRKIPRPLTLGEINIISDALRSRSYSKLNDYIIEQSLQKDLTLNKLSQSALKSSQNMLVQTVNKPNEEILREFLDAYQKDQYIKLLPYDSEELRKAVKQDNYNAIQPKFLDQFYENLFKNILNNSINDNLVTYFKMSIKSMESRDISNIASFKFFVTNDELKLTLYEVFLRYNEIDKYYNIRVRSMKTLIIMDSPLMILKINDEKMISIRDGHNDDEIAINFTPLMNLFELINQL